MSTIYLVMAAWNYEGSAPVRGFTSRERAESLAAQCREHQAIKPPCPDAIDTPENDAEWEAWYPLNEKWCAEHPAGEGSASADNFIVIELELNEEPA